MTTKIDAQKMLPKILKILNCNAKVNHAILLEDCQILLVHQRPLEFNSEFASLR